MNGSAGWRGSDFEREWAVLLLARAISSELEGSGEVEFIQPQAPVRLRDRQSAKSADVVELLRSGGRRWYEVTTEDSLAKARKDVRDLWLGFLARRDAGQERSDDACVFVVPTKNLDRERSLRDECSRDWTEAPTAVRRAFLDQLRFESPPDGGIRSFLKSSPMSLLPEEANALVGILGSLLRPEGQPVVPPVRISDVLSHLATRSGIPTLTPPPHEVLEASREAWWVDRSTWLEELDHLLTKPGPILLTGNAGCGKSTLVDDWARQLNEKARASASRMRAARFDDPTAVRRLRDRVRWFARRGGKVFILDGLDELWNTEALQRAREFLDAMADEESPRLLLVCRPSEAEFLRSPLRPSWNSIELPEFTFEELEGVRNSISDGVLNPLPEHPGLRDLVRNAFRLKLLVAILRKGDQSVWTRLDRVSNDTEFLCESWSEQVRRNPRASALGLERSMLKLVHRLTRDGLDRVGRLVIDVSDPCIDAAQSLGILAPGRDLGFSSRIVRDFLTALAFREDASDPDGLEWLLTTPDVGSSHLVLRHWVAIEIWESRSAPPVPARSGLQMTWTRMVNELPPPLAVEAAETLVRIADRDLAGHILDWTSGVDAARRRDCRAWMLKHRAQVILEPGQCDVEIEGVLLSAAASLTDDCPFTELVEFAFRAVDVAPQEQRADMAHSVTLVFDRILGEPALVGQAKAYLLGRLLRPLATTLRDKPEKLRIRMDSLDLSDSFFVQDTLSCLAEIAGSLPETAASLWRRCVAAHTETGNRDDVFWSADRQVDGLLERAPAPMTAAILDAFEVEGRRADDRHARSVQRASKLLGVASGPPGEAEVVDPDLCRWLGSVRAHRIALLEIAGNRVPFDPVAARSQVRAALFAGAIELLRCSDLPHEDREALSRLATSLIQTFRDTDPPAILESAGTALAQAADADLPATRQWAVEAALGALDAGAASIVAHLRAASSEEARRLGEAASGTAKPRQLQSRDRGGAAPLPPDDVFLGQLDDSEGIDRTTAGYSATIAARLKLFSNQEKIAAGWMDDEITQLAFGLEREWNTLASGDSRLREKLERELAAAAEGWAGFLWSGAQTETGTHSSGSNRGDPDPTEELRTWVRRFLIEHAASTADPEPDDREARDDLAAISSGTRARCARGLLAIARGDSLVEEELRQLDTLAADPSPRVRVEVLRGLEALRSHHESYMWTLAESAAAREHGHGGSAAILWMWRSLPLDLRPSITTRIIETIWRRRVHWSNVGSRGRPEEVAIGSLPDLVARTGNGDANQLLDELLARSDEPTLALGLARGAGVLLEQTAAGHGADAAASQRSVEMVRRILGAFARQARDQKQLDGVIRELVVSLVRSMRFPGGYHRIPAEVWTALCAIPPDRGPSALRDLVWLSSEILPHDRSRALDLAELAILCEGGDLLDASSASRVAGHISALVESLLSRLPEEEDWDSRLLRLMDAFARFQLESIRTVRERILQARSQSSG